MSKEVILAGTTQIAIFDDTHENAEKQINKLFTELKIKAQEICSEKYHRYVNKKGQGCTYAVIRFQQNPAK